MTTAQECMDVARQLLDRASVAPEAWPMLRHWMKRAVVGRAMGTNDSAVIDQAVKVADYCFARARTTGSTGDATLAAYGGLMAVGGIFAGIALTLAYQQYIEER